VAAVVAETVIKHNRPPDGTYNLPNLHDRLPQQV